MFPQKSGRAESEEEEGRGLLIVSSWTTVTQLARVARAVDNVSSATPTGDSASSGLKFFFFS